MGNTCIGLRLSTMIHTRALWTWSKYLYIFNYTNILQTSTVSLGIHFNILCLSLGLFQKVNVGKNIFLFIYLNLCLWCFLLETFVNDSLPICPKTWCLILVMIIEWKKYGLGNKHKIASHYSISNNPDINHKQL